MGKQNSCHMELSDQEENKRHTNHWSLFTLNIKEQKPTFMSHIAKDYYYHLQIGKWRDEKNIQMSYLDTGKDFRKGRQTMF